MTNLCKCNLEEQGMKLYTKLKWVRVGLNGGILWTEPSRFIGYYLRISWSAERLSAFSDRSVLWSNATPAYAVYIETFLIGPASGFLIVSLLYTIIT
jgi:hypothetical protein